MTKKATAPTPAPERTITLSEVRNIFARPIAAAEIAKNGEYFCVLDGKRTRVIAG